MYHGGRYIRQRRDANEGDVVELLHANGFETLRVDGAPFDLVVWCRPGRGFLLLETKTRRGRMTVAQQRFFAATGGLPRVAVKTPEAAVVAAVEHCRLYAKGAAWNDATISARSTGTTTAP